MREGGTQTRLGLAPKSRFGEIGNLCGCLCGREDAMGKFLVLLVDNQGTEGVHGKDHGKAAHMPPA